MQLRAGIFAVAINIFFWLVFLCAERYVVRRKVIPPRSIGKGKVLYLLDFAIISWGDAIGLLAIDFGVAAGLTDQTLPYYVAVLATLLAGVCTFFANRSWMTPPHRPSSGYPAPGIISVAGKTHLLYFFLQLTVAFVGVYVLFTTTSPTTRNAIIMGAIIYGTAALVDLRKGLIEFHI